EFCVVRSRIFREVWVADFASRSCQKSPIGSAFDAYGADHAHIGWRLELNLDLIIALEGKINIERHTTSAYCRSSRWHEGLCTSGSVRNSDSNGQIDRVSPPASHLRAARSVAEEPQLAQVSPSQINDS